MLWVCPHFTDERLRFRKERLWEQSLSWMEVTDPDMGHSARKWPPSQNGHEGTQPASSGLGLRGHQPHCRGHVLTPAWRADSLPEGLACGRSPGHHGCQAPRLRGSRWRDSGRTHPLRNIHFAISIQVPVFATNDGNVRTSEKLRTLHSALERGGGESAPAERRPEEGLADADAREGRGASLSSPWTVPRALIPSLS